jgi:hypothetical protein
VWPQYWDLYEPRGPAKGPKGVKSHPTKKKYYVNISNRFIVLEYFNDSVE